MNNGVRSRVPKALAGLLVLAGCGGRNVYQPPPPPAVTVSRPVRQAVTDYLELTGNTQAINTVQLRARVQGYLEKVFFKDGDRVTKGQLLFLIQQNTYQARLEQAKANVLAQQANLEHAQTEYARYSNLVRQRAASQTDLDQWRYQRDAAQAGVLSARAAVQLAELDLAYTRVTAPFDGRIDRRLVDPGNLVGPGTSTVLATVNQIDPIYVYFTINERDLLHAMSHNQVVPDWAGRSNIPIHVGLADDAGYPHEGRLDFAAISVTSTTGTLLLRGILPNPDGGILPGMFARVRIPVDREPSALLVPESALGFDQQGDYVLVVEENNLVERRAVRLGPQVGGYRTIEKGLNGREWVITGGLLRAMPGRPVTPDRKQLPGPATRPTTTAASPPAHSPEGPRP